MKITRSPLHEAALTEADININDRVAIIYLGDCSYYLGKIIAKSKTEIAILLSDGVTKPRKGLKFDKEEIGLKSYDGENWSHTRFVLTEIVFKNYLPTLMKLSVSGAICSNNTKDDSFCVDCSDDNCGGYDCGKINHEC